MRVCVTGAGGFLGRNIAALESSWVALSSKDVDFLDQEVVDSFFARNEFEAVVHCAARLKQNCKITTYENLVMFENLVRSFKGKIIYISSGAALTGQPPTEPYAFSKGCRVVIFS